MTDYPRAVRIRFGGSHRKNKEHLRLLAIAGIPHGPIYPAALNSKFRYTRIPAEMLDAARAIKGITKARDQRGADLFIWGIRNEDI